jgi:hypothetical protein
MVNEYVWIVKESNESVKSDYEKIGSDSSLNSTVTLDGMKHAHAKAGEIGKRYRLGDPTIIGSYSYGFSVPLNDARSEEFYNGLKNVLGVTDESSLDTDHDYYDAFVSYPKAGNAGTIYIKGPNESNTNNVQIGVSFNEL